MNLLRKQLERDEGRVAWVYQDSNGYWTIGVGHLVDRRKGGAVPDCIIDALLDYDIAKHKQDLDAALPWAKTLDDARYAALINMTFNLGINGLLGFHHTLEAIRLGDFNGAANSMLNSKWADQVGPRALRLAQQMRSGVWQ